jgi:hypothetical protein
VQATLAETWMPRLAAEEDTPAEETDADDSSNGLWITASGAVEDKESCFGSAPLLNED